MVLDDGTPISFFIKVLPKENGKNMVRGEYESMKEIYTLLPDFAPKPIAWGTYKDVPDMHFFLCEYREMVHDMPYPNKFAARLAELHQNSKSMNGKFGFHVTTYSGICLRRPNGRKAGVLLLEEYEATSQRSGPRAQCFGPNPV